MDAVESLAQHDQHTQVQPLGATGDGAPIFPAHEPGFHLSLHRRHEPGTGEARTAASALVVMTERSGTHIDALCHQAENMEMFGGVKRGRGRRRSGGEAAGP